MRWIACLMVLGVAVPAARTVTAAPIDRDFDKEFTVSPGAILHLEQGDGTVTITPWDKDVVAVSVRYRASVTRVGMGSDLGFDVEFQQTGKTITIVDKEGGGTTIGFMYRKVQEHSYRIQAPSYVVLELKGEDGDVTITDWKGDITSHLDDGALHIDGARAGRIGVTSEDGDVVLSGLTGELTVKCDDGSVEVSDSELERARIDTEDGDVRVAGCRGDFTIEVDDGDVGLRQVHAGTTRIRTEDGDVDLRLLSAESVEVVVEDGAVRVGLDPGMSVAFSLHADEGEITVDLPGAGTLSKKDNTVSGEWNGAKSKLSVSTDDGDIVLREAP
jgi:DUF4097 and DUF4098 domain-containing protein YvlB